MSEEHIAMYKATIIYLVAILIGTALIYSPGLGAYFVADDFRYLELAGQVHSPADIISYVNGACTQVGWPAVILVFWLGRMLTGFQPESYRLIALSLHLLNAILVFVLARRVMVSQKMMPAIVAALVLAFHPRQHEGVMWLSTVTWTMGTGLSLLAALCYAHWRQTGCRVWLALSMPIVALAMLANPSVIVLPIILAAYDVMYKRWRPGDVFLWAGLIIMVVLLGFMCGLGRLPTSGERAFYGLALSGVSHIGLFVLYILWPVPLNLKEILAAMPLIGYGTAGLLLIAIIILGLAMIWHGTALLRWGIIWAIAGILPPSFFSSATSDHYMTLMLPGVALACAGLVEMTAERWQRWIIVAAILWLLFVLPQIAIKVDHWQFASQIAATVRDETMTRYPSPANGARFFYMGLPDIVNRCVVWTYGLDSAVRIWYNNPTLRARKDVQFGVRNAPTPEDIVLDFSGWW